MIKRGRNKFNAVKVVINGITFASTKEGKRYRELELLVRAGEIRDLNLQVKFNFEKNGIKVEALSYWADFTYYDCKKEKDVVEDVKGYKTDVYEIKKKLMKAFYGIEIFET